MKKLITVYIYFSLLFSGATVLLIEILGTRILAPLFGTTIYVWTGLITVTLFSLAVGYFLGGRLADKFKNLMWYFMLFILTGLSLLVAFEFRGTILLFADNFGYAYGPLIASALLFVTPLSFLGMIDPWAIKLKTNHISLVGTGAGNVFGISTIGGLIGGLSAAYVLLPNFHISQIFLSLGFILLIIGLIGFVFEKTRLKKSVLLLVVLIGLSTLIAALGTNLSKKAVMASKKITKGVILYESQNLYSLNRVVAIPALDGVRCFAADGGLQTCIDPNNKDYVGYTAKMGLFINQLPKKSSMLLLGMGGGKIIKDWGRNDISTDIVDINPATFYASQKYLGVKLNLRQKPYLMDARRFLRTNNKKYDLILIDVSTTLTPPAHLYTREFFASVKNHLNDSGFVVFQIVDDNPNKNKSFQSFLATVASELPYTYSATDGIGILLVMGRQENKQKMDEINVKIKEIQARFNAKDQVHGFVTIKPNLSNVDIVTDDYNLAETYWRDKIPLIKRFNVVLREDFI